MSEVQPPDRTAGTGSTPGGHSPGPAGRSWLANRKDRLRGLRRILIFDIAGPLIAYTLLRSYGTSQVLSLILSGILPAIAVLIDFTHNHSLDVVGFVVLGGLLLGAILGLLTHSPRAVLLEGSAVTAAFALSALGSLLAQRPLMFHFAQAAMGGEHSPAGQDFTHHYDTTPSVRRFFRTVTLIWGLAFVLEAAVKVIVIETSSTGSALTFTRIAPYPLVGVLLIWTMARGRAIRRHSTPSTAATT